ncbi:hypothetical protein H6F98_05345 [Microcoleus sp. FACHB-SPT15]|uniref:hypothetical protein n=1 Tax=Microcoleus sp. FACHB-SPT15 TaxID=2692830 RepID=UPI00177CF1AB|nr:hypothetical protein [Microcoleus sp. FACHB-SPT15]MBD1804880.1 hypothetical protein [Microcoleus sp. FACHB-SPT15]
MRCHITRLLHQAAARTEKTSSESSGVQVLYDKDPISDRQYPIDLGSTLHAKIIGLNTWD